MLKPEQLEELLARLTDTIPPAISHLKSDLQKNFRSVLQSAFARMNLVTREEFDIQTTVLTRAKEKLEDLEKQLAAWEQKK